jgi:nitrite reductase (NADH) large subunit
MKVLIIGGGVSGITAADILMQKNKSADVTIVTSEGYPYYFRPKLPDMLAGQLVPEKIIAHSLKWYEQKGIKLILDTKVEALDSIKKIGTASDGQVYTFDNLVLACGSRSFLPPIPGINKNGVFSVWTIDDVYAIKEKLHVADSAVVIGGGVLGIELALSLNQIGIKVAIVESSEVLMNRQLDETAGKMLARLLKDKGISIFSGTAVSEIIGENDVCGIQLKDGQILSSQIVIVAAGARPNTELAKQAGLEVDRGIVVDQHMMTSIQNIYAVGDAAQFNGIIYGTVQSGIDQAKVAAMNIAGEKSDYWGTVRSNTLNVSGVRLTSLGDVHAKGDAVAEYSDMRDRAYKKLVLDDGRLVGAIWFGDMAKIRNLAELINRGFPIENYAASIVKGELDPGDLLRQTGTSS